ncbi:MAG: hypothetical protein HOY78_32455, partial [Saccharothrix sp.]|nr:hypothetical protein [Saccharothrix sp.]
MSGYEIYLMVTQGAGASGLTQAADLSRDAGTRIQAVGDVFRRLTPELQSVWQGDAADRATQAGQPIEQGLQQAQETLGQIDTAVRAQAQSYSVLKGRVLPMATPEPPDLTLYDQITPWDTDNELARKQWFEADANNRRVYAEYVTATNQNMALLPQPPAAAGGAQGANTAVQSASGPGARSTASAPPSVGGGGGATSPSSAGAGAGAGGGAGQASAPPSVGGGGGKTSA